MDHVTFLFKIVNNPPLSIFKWSPKSTDRKSNSFIMTSDTFMTLPLNQLNIIYLWKKIHFCFPIHSVCIPSFNYSLSQQLLNHYYIPDIVKANTKTYIAHSLPSRNTHTNVNWAKVNKNKTKNKTLKDFDQCHNRNIIYQGTEVGKTSYKRWHLSSELNMVNIYHVRVWRKIFQNSVNTHDIVQWYERGWPQNNKCVGNTALKGIF